MSKPRRRRRSVARPVSVAQELGIDVDVLRRDSMSFHPDNRPSVLPPSHGSTRRRPQSAAASRTEASRRSQLYAQGPGRGASSPQARGRLGAMHATSGTRGGSQHRQRRSRGGSLKAGRGDVDYVALRQQQLQQQQLQQQRSRVQGSAGHGHHQRQYDDDPLCRQPAQRPRSAAPALAGPVRGNHMSHRGQQSADQLLLDVPPPQRQHTASSAPLVRTADSVVLQTPAPRPAPSPQHIRSGSGDASSAPHTLTAQQLQLRPADGSGPVLTFPVPAALHAGGDALPMARQDSRHPHGRGELPMWAPPAAGFAAEMSAGGGGGTGGGVQRGGVDTLPGVDPEQWYDVTSHMTRDVGSRTTHLHFNTHRPTTSEVAVHLHFNLPEHGEPQPQPRGVSRRSLRGSPASTGPRRFSTSRAPGTLRRSRPRSAAARLRGRRRRRTGSIAVSDVSMTSEEDGDGAYHDNSITAARNGAPQLVSVAIQTSARRDSAASRTSDSGRPPTDGRRVSYSSSRRPSTASRSRPRSAALESVAESNEGDGGSEGGKTTVAAGGRPRSAPPARVTFRARAQAILSAASRLRRRRPQSAGPGGPRHGQARRRRRSRPRSASSERSGGGGRWKRATGRLKAASKLKKGKKKAQRRRRRSKRAATALLQGWFRRMYWRRLRAATRIQAGARGYFVRREIRRLGSHAASIQALFRGFVVRTNYAAARSIQGLARVFIARCRAWCVARMGLRGSVSVPTYPTHACCAALS